MPGSGSDRSVRLFAHPRVHVGPSDTIKCASHCSALMFMIVTGRRRIGARHNGADAPWKSIQRSECSLFRIRSAPGGGRLPIGGTAPPASARCRSCNARPPSDHPNPSCMTASPFQCAPRRSISPLAVDRIDHLLNHDLAIHFPVPSYFPRPANRSSFSSLLGSLIVVAVPSGHVHIMAYVVCPAHPEDDVFVAGTHGVGDLRSLTDPHRYSESAEGVHRRGRRCPEGSRYAPGDSSATLGMTVGGIGVRSGHNEAGRLTARLRRCAVASPLGGLAAAGLTRPETAG